MFLLWLVWACIVTGTYMLLTNCMFNIKPPDNWEEKSKQSCFLENTGLIALCLVCPIFLPLAIMTKFLEKRDANYTYEEPHREIDIYSPPQEKKRTLFTYPNPQHNTRDWDKSLLGDILDDVKDM
jgi:hypothetical protein